jgi:hypothetical protein
MWPANWIKLFRTFPQPSRYPQLPTLSHCCPPHPVPYLPSAHSVPTVTNTVTLLPSTPCSVPSLSPVGTHSYQHCHTAALHTLFRTFSQPSRYPQLPTLSHCCPPHTKLNTYAQLHCQQSTFHHFTLFTSQCYSFRSLLPEGPVGHSMEDFKAVIFFLPMNQYILCLTPPPLSFQLLESQNL